MARQICTIAGQVPGTLGFSAGNMKTSSIKFDYMFCCDTHGEHYDWNCPICDDTKSKKVYYDFGAPCRCPGIKDENIILRRLLWLNHGHTGQYGDDGEMQAAIRNEGVPSAGVRQIDQSIGHVALGRFLGMRRSASTWLYNAARLLLSSSPSILQQFSCGWIGDWKKIPKKREFF